MVKNLVGPPVVGEDFVGRKEELAEAVRMISQGNSLLLASPRRVGKSSFSKKLVEMFRREGVLAAYIDLQGVRTEQEFGDRMADAFRKIREESSKAVGLKDKVESFLNRIRKVEVKGVGFELKDNPQKFYTAVEKLMDFEGKALIVVDELAVFLEHITTAQGPEAAENLMNWLRNIRQSHQGRVVWVYCSSVSITNFVKRHNMSYTINDISSFPLGEMAYEEAAHLLKELCYGQGVEVFSDDDIDVMLEKIGWRLPFFIQLFFKNFIQNQASYKGQPMDKVVDEIVSIIIREHQIATWSERLSGYGAYEKPAQLLLNYLCQPNHKSERSHLETIISPACDPLEDVGKVYAELRQMLDNDGYLMESNQGDIVFRSPIIRQYWYNKFVK
jgi:hypothetical protein